MAISAEHRELREILESGQARIENALVSPIRAIYRQLEPQERKLFRTLAQNRPGPGPAISNPENHGFLKIAETDWGGLRRHVREAPFGRDREAMFQDAVSLVHRLKDNFYVYVGRTFVRDGEEHLGPNQRWGNHYNNKNMRWAKVLARVPRERVEYDETLAISLVKTWEAYDALCCNNDVLSRPGANLSDDDQQLLYLCLKRKR